ncbi:hypothetical protein CONLIGDRAFT_390352 [Coniochaeta ligniaria NRRL 30616]|uniref:G domain-containing protein n=1 Tax=Coniochaeta ligniaria NRRL 30616 TaxID=1408157 RepID=A0A1J7JG54_9PEZI|nr:hypothetical protein CONLIGDRAFT_390352 [Coniochaeta ligniaria NRRL 30616]
MPYRVLNPDSPIVVLVIGPSQNGKTTFINQIIRMSGKKVDFGMEGDRSTSCTTKVGFFDVEIPTSEYIMFDRETRREVDVPDIAVDEHRVLDGNWWRKQSSSRFDIRLRDPDAPYLKLRLIDTPGLDDSANKDFENMQDVLTALNALAKSSEEWKRSINAIVLVYNSNNAFSFSFQTVIKHYHQCMPNLFGGLAVINTHFDLANLSRKKAHLIRDRLLSSNADNARANIIKQRAADFKKALGENLGPSHFFLDSKPKETLAYPELLSRNTIASIVSFWRAASPMPITQMRLVKSADMLAIDAKLQRRLQVAIDGWSSNLRELKKAATDRQALRSSLQQTMAELTNSIARCQEDLDRWDNDTVFPIQTYTTDDDPSAMALFFKGTIFRRRVKGTMSITESAYERFTVEPTSSARGRWLTQNCGYDAATKTWRGEYEGEPGKSPNLLARSQTTNRIKYRDVIADKRRSKRNYETKMADHEAEWSERFAGLSLEAAAEKTGDNETDRKLDQLVLYVETAKNLVEILRQPDPPIDKAFNASAQSRYTKRPGEVTDKDLIDFVIAAELSFDLVKPLKKELTDDEEA